MKVEPIKNYLLVEITENQEVTKSGIILASTARGESNLAKVVEIAPVFEDEQYIFSKGDMLVINPHSGTEVKIENKEYRIISYKDVYAILRD